MTGQNDGHDSGTAVRSVNLGQKEENHEWYSLAPGVSHPRLFPRECLLPSALLTVWGVGGGGRGWGTHEGRARFCLELARQLEGVAEAQVSGAGGRVY